MVAADPAGSEAGAGSVAGVTEDDWDPRDPHVLSDQLAAYDRMRRECPVAHSDYLGWSVFRHEDVVRVVTDHDTFSSVVSSYPAVPNGFDPPKHMGYRRLVDRYFTPAHMEAFEPLCRDVARELVATVPRDRAVEFIAEFALEYALQSQRVWLGWPAYTVESLRHWTARNHRATLAREREELVSVAAEFDAVVRRVLDDNRGQAADGAVAESVTVELMRDRLETADGESRRLSDDEIVSILRNWTVGELATLSASVGILVDHLARHPERQELLRRDPSLLPATIDEILRLHAPLIANRRVATRDVELGGRMIRAGERVNVNWASANRDEAVFGGAGGFQPEAHAAENLLYGRGIHDCPGAPLARLELRVVIDELLAATDSITMPLEAQPDFAVYPASGFRTLHVTVS